MSVTNKSALKKHQGLAQENYDRALRELGEAGENFRVAEQRKRDAQVAHAKADELIKMADTLYKFFYPEPEPTEEPQPEQPA